MSGGDVVVGALDGRVAIITGAGRGLGRAHALLFAREGASVVVNDLGGGRDGSGASGTPADEVVEEIRSAGGTAVANADDVTSWEGAQHLVDSAVEAFGDLHILVNNAGILRDRMLVNMSEEDFDAVVRVHLKGHFAPARHAANLWRDRAKSGDSTPRSIINSSSGSGLYGNPGQTNYGAAKAGIAAMTHIWARELERYHVRVNAISPVARTRLTEDTLRWMGGPGEDGIDFWAPENVSPLVGYLATAGCPFSGHVFAVQGGQVALLLGWGVHRVLEKEQRWTVGELEAALAPLAHEPVQGDWEPLREKRQIPAAEAG
jgi:NAD(P)-dependent dehydrogenase (short-subunit alcohol dehydrogenase family)